MSSVIVEIRCSRRRFGRRQEEATDLFCGIAVELGNVGGVDPGRTRR